MSIRVMSLVWDHFQRGGSEKLAMLALADWCNDNGSSLHPSVSAVARKICVSQDQARRILHKFIEEGLLTVVGNEGGGKPGSTRQYQLNIAALRAGIDASPTPGMDARGGLAPTTGTDASPTTGAHARGGLAPMQGDALHPCKPNHHRSTIEPPEKKPGAVAPSSGDLLGEAPKEPGRCTFTAYRAYCQAIKRPVVVPKHAVFVWADSVKLPRSFLKLAWQVFEQRFTTDEKAKRKLYTDWPGTFMTYVKNGYLGLWVIDRSTQEFVLTTAGVLAEREHNAEQRHAA